MAKYSSTLADIIGDPYAGFEPKMADIKLSRTIFVGVREILKFYGRQLMHDAGWRFFGVKQTRGRCYYGPKVITIPEWVLSRATDYKEWYIAHEMAHAYSYLDGKTDNHGPNFMEMLKSICPPDCIHYELGYKPQNASAAGIRLPSTKQLTLDDIL